MSKKRSITNNVSSNPTEQSKSNQPNLQQILQTLNQLTRDVEQLATPTPKDQIPISIFNAELSPLEAIATHLHNQENSNANIASGSWWLRGARVHCCDNATNEIADSGPFGRIVHTLCPCPRPKAARLTPERQNVFKSSKETGSMAGSTDMIAGFVPGGKQSTTDSNDC